MSFLSNLFSNLQRLGQAPPDDDFWYGSAGGKTWSGNTISEESSLQSGGVYSCNRVLADDVAQCHCGLYRWSPSKGRIFSPKHPVHWVLRHQANDLQTSFEFWEHQVSSLNLWGNAYGLPRYDDDRNLTAIEALNPAGMTVTLDERTNTRVYVYQAGTKRTVYIGEEIWHVPGFSFDGIKGYSPIQLLRQNIGEGLAAEEYGARFYSNNAAPRMYVSQPGALGKDSRDALTKWFKDNFGGLSNAHKLGVLEGGGEIKSVPVNHRDIQFLELRKFKLEDIARIFRVPLHLIQHLDRATNNNIEHQSIDYVTHSIRPLTVRLQERVNMQLLKPSERGKYFAEFDTSVLIEGDMASKGEFISKMTNSGELTPNEGRQRIDMNPVSDPAADRLYMQGAMLPLDKLGQQEANNENS